MTRDISQSAPDSTGGYGNTGVPGNTTTADTLFGGGSSDSYARGGAGAATGARQDRDHDDDNTVPTSSGNFAQSALDRAAGFGSTSVPGDTTTDRTLSETDDSVESSTGKPSIGQRLKSQSSPAFFRVRCADLFFSRRRRREDSTQGERRQRAQRQ